MTDEIAARVIQRIAEVAEAVAWQAGVGGMETAGSIVSFLAAHPEHIADFMAEGSVMDWLIPASRPLIDTGSANSGPSEGGKARAAKLSPERRSEIARRAATARWAVRDADLPTAAEVRGILRDTDRSGEAIETPLGGSTEGESAVPEGQSPK